MSASLRDAVYGAAVGDALGVPYEFMERGTFECTGMMGHGVHDQPAGTFSDDTSLTLATCDSIRACDKADMLDIRERFTAWLDYGTYKPRSKRLNWLISQSTAPRRNIRNKTNTR